MDHATLWYAILLGYAVIVIVALGRRAYTDPPKTNKSFEA